MTKTARLRRIRLHPYVEAALAKRLSKYSSAITVERCANIEWCAS
jgi:hypothetical protein